MKYDSLHLYIFVSPSLSFVHIYHPNDTWYIHQTIWQNTSQYIARPEFDIKLSSTTLPLPSPKEIKYRVGLLETLHFRAFDNAVGQLRFAVFNLWRKILN